MTKPTALSIVLTGGTTGIGAATVARLEAQGHRVTVLDIARPDAAVSFIQCDLSDPDAIDRAVEQLPGQIDRLVNVAGLSNAAPDDKILQVNFLGMRYLTEQLVPRIADGGCVVIVASSAGHDWRNRKAVIDGLLDTPDFATGMHWLQNNLPEWQANPYKFSKQCAAAYTYRAAGLAIQRGVRVNCVNPGSTGTQLTADFRQLVGEEMYDWGVQQVGREGTPDDIAEVIDFLATGNNRWLNGVELVVDGGFIAGLTGGWIDLQQSPNAK
jgi:NAD(P)-dependent dehydrogenase (short-subunit alcohol dehydrogenase family)